MEQKYRIAQLVLALALPINLAVGAWLYSGEKREDLAQFRKFVRVVDLIRNCYVTDDEKVIGYTNLTEGALNGMLHHLDQHSSYHAPAEAEYFSETNRGEFSGIGIEFHTQQGRPLVVQVVPGGPAEEAGVAEDDLIMAIDGQDTRELTSEKVRELVKGKSETSVRLRLKRPGQEAEFDVNVTRRMVEFPTIRQARLLADGIGYVEIIQFNEKTYQELRRVLLPWQDQLRGLILDLRYNPGGMLTAAVDICGLFLPEGTLIVTTVPRDKSQKEAYTAGDGNPKFLEIPLVLLINEGSASASEIVAGCMKDHQRATLVGARSYGKGSVQIVFRLPEDGSSVHLTTRYYYTPSNRLIHGKGIMPNVEVSVPEENAAKLYRQLHRYRVDSKPDNVPDPQLDRAIAAMREKLKLPPVTP